MKLEIINKDLVCNSLFVHQRTRATILLSVTASLLVTFSVSRCTIHVPVRDVDTYYKYLNSDVCLAATDYYGSHTLISDLYSGQQQNSIVWLIKDNQYNFCFAVVII